MAETMITFRGNNAEGKIDTNIPQQQVFYMKNQILAAEIAVCSEYNKWMFLFATWEWLKQLMLRFMTAGSEEEIRVGGAI